MILKYIILKNKNTPILFPREPFSHYEVAYSLGDVISAGFCVIRIKEEKLQIKCFGESLTLLNPIRYFVEFIRMVLLKGSGFYEVLPNLLIVTGFAVFVNGMAVWSYKKSN